jgi:hypothetical protein
MGRSVPILRPEFEFPSFFDAIMVPGSDFDPTDISQMPPDLSGMMPERDFPTEGEIFGTNFAPTIDQAMEAFFYPESQQTVQEHELSVTNTRPSTEPSDAQKRFAIFKRSPWLWKPEAKQGTFSEHTELPLDEERLDITSSPHQPFLPSLTMQDELSPRSRDRIYELVLKAAKSQVTIPSFPSAGCLDTLLKVGVAKKVETDAWIHPYTFRSESTMPELLAALVAAGCVCFGIPSVNKTGGLLLEIARVALAKLVEEDNSVLRNLQYLQASMMWIDISATCGFKRKQVSKTGIKYFSPETAI